MGLFTSIRGGVRDFLGMSSREETRSSIPPQSVLRAALSRECNRSDRTGQELSLILFELGHQPETALMEHLAEAINRRIRTTDEHGWYDEHRVGLLLPHTSAKGAIGLAEDICRRVAASAAVIPSFYVYTYPSRWDFEDSTQTGVGTESDSQAVSAETSKAAGGQKARCISAEMQRIHALAGPALPPWKRALDLAVSAAALTVLTPLFVLTAVYIKIVSPGPIFFSQMRVGYLGRNFRLWKFRTMHVNAETRSHRQLMHDVITSERPMTKLDSFNDPRIIPLGSLIRAMGIDELPQIFNVVRGEMSLVGPRPCLPYEAEKYRSWHTRRFDAVPGLTGLWQVSGKNRTTFNDMVRFDVRYSRRMSLRSDLAIMLKTIPALYVELMNTVSKR